jgi:CelD/BcsL family acetyltransferase involved in cellulose biosynthesis
MTSGSSRREVRLPALLDAPAALRIDDLTSAAELDALHPEWQALWDRSPRATPFQSPDWLCAWWRHFGGEGLWTITVRRDERLIGILPLFVWSGAGPRQLTPVGNGISDHVDLLAEPGAEDDVAAAIVAHLAESADVWDTADLRDLPEDSPLLSIELSPEIHATVEDDEPCPALPLPPSLDALDDVIPAPFLKKLRYYRRRLEREFAVRFESATDRASASVLFDALLRLHRARWLERGEPGVFADPAVVTFHRDVIPVFLARGWLRLHALRLDGEIAAVWYGFAAKRRVHYYIGGFDPALDRYSLGTVLVGHAIERAIEDGATELDFLRGREPYKYAWGAADRPQKRLRLRIGGSEVRR